MLSRASQPIQTCSCFATTLRSASESSTESRTHSGNFKIAAGHAQTPEDRRHPLPRPRDCWHSARTTQMLGQRGLITRQRELAGRDGAVARGQRKPSRRSWRWSALPRSPDAAWTQVGSPEPRAATACGSYASPCQRSPTLMPQPVQIHRMATGLTAGLASTAARGSRTPPASATRTGNRGTPPRSRTAQRNSKMLRGYEGRATPPNTNHRMEQTGIRITD